jgi:hypothetical protein
MADRGSNCDQADRIASIHWKQEAGVEVNIEE